MGFFSKFAAKVSSVVSATVRTVKKAALSFINAASDAIDWAKDKLGNTAYNSRSVESRVNVEKALSDFKFAIDSRARDAEDASIAAAMQHFDSFAEDLSAHFPELVSLVRIRQAEAGKLLSHTIINYVHEHISENDADFQSILEMDPGPAKEQALDRQMTGIIDRAQSVFGKKVKEQLRLLNDELNVRLEQKLRSEEEMLSTIAKKYEMLEQQTADESLDLQQLEEECEPVIEAAACIQHILNEEKEPEE